MGLRSLAKRVVSKVVGGGGEAPSPTPTRAAPTRPAPPPALESPDAGSMATIECGAQELFERLEAGETVVLIDVRSDQEYAGGVIADAHLIPLHDLSARWEEVKDANEVVCYCAVGARSLQAAHFLRDKGIFNATSMEGGLVAWRQAGGSVVSPK